MALSDEVQTRYSAQFLRNLTNPDNPEATSVNTTTLDAAATDTEGDFKRVLGRAYDGTLSEDVSVAVEGVVAKLAERNGRFTEQARGLVEKYDGHLRGLRRRVLPKSSSQLTPTEEQRGTETVRPDFDDRKFDDFVPESPE